MTTMTIRIDENVKKEAETLFGQLGLSVSGAVNVFLRQAIREKAIPFKIKAAGRYDEYFNEHNLNVLEKSAAQAKAGKVVKKTLAELEAME